MNIWFVLSAPRDLMGGGETFAISLGAWFRARGHRVDVVVRPESRVGEAAKASFLHVRTLAMRNDFDFLSRMQLKRWFKAERPSVVFGGWGRDIKLSGRAARAAGAQMFWLQGTVLSDNSRIHKHIDREYVTAHIVPSVFTGRELAGRSNVSQRKIHVVYPAVDIRRFEPDGVSADNAEQFRRAHSIPSDALVAVCLSRFVDIKGHDVLLEAWARVAGQMNNAYLILAGDGPLKDSLVQQAQRLKIDERVRFVGHIPDVRPVLWNADLLVFPSRAEPLGMVTLEAMASDVPVIASRVGGIPEIIEHEQSGLLVEPGNDAELAQAILLLLGDQSLRMRLVEGGRARLKNFLPDASFAPLEKLIGATPPERT
jgi:glycosyltransferase involved in cell wall biosynthesis